MRDLLTKRLAGKQWETLLVNLVFLVGIAVVLLQGLRGTLRGLQTLDAAGDIPTPRVTLGDP